MTPLYITFILIIFFYKMVIKLLFNVNVYSQDKDDVSNDLKRWKFSFRDIIYYLAIILAVVYPIIYNEINIANFFIGLIPIVTSLCLYVLAIQNEDYTHALLIDVLFIEGIGIQSGCWIVGVMGFVYLAVLYIFCRKSPKN